MIRALLVAAFVSSLAACASVPEEKLDAAGVAQLCARLAAEPGLLQRGSIGHRILASANAPAGCRDAAHDAASASDHHRLVDAYETVRTFQ